LISLHILIILHAPNRGKMG